MWFKHLRTASNLIWVYILLGVTPNSQNFILFWAEPDLTTILRVESSHFKQESFGKGIYGNPVMHINKVLYSL